MHASDPLQDWIDQLDPGPTPAQFRKALRIDADGRPVPFSPDPWQEADFSALDPAWLALAGHGAPAPVRRAWQERPRGHSKTSDLAIMVAWALAFSARPVRGVAAAGDKDQARLLRDAVGTLARLNPALGALDVQAWRVVNRQTGSQLDVLSSDVATSYGQLPDFVVCDEVAHWPEGRGEALWASLFSAAAKRAHCLFIVLSNAGFEESWVRTAREAVRADPAWHFSRLDGPQASWITPDRLEEQRRILPPVVFDRLWLNLWSAGYGDALAPQDIDAALTLAGPAPAREEGFGYFAGLDLSVSRDHSALVLLGKHWTGRLRLARVLAWAPPKGGKVDLPAVEQAAWETHLHYRPKFLLDPYQAELLAQRLTRRGVWLEQVAFVGKALTEMASGLVEVFASRTIDLYRDDALLADLRRLRIAEGPSGWKLAAPRTAAGHCDRATALALAVLGARRRPLQTPGEGPCVLSAGRRDPTAGDVGPGAPAYPWGRGALGFGSEQPPPWGRDLFGP
jgi:hypothetical protein